MQAVTLAAKKGYFELIGIYLHNGGDPDLKALNQGYTMMHEAVIAGQPAVVEVRDRLNLTVQPNSHECSFSAGTMHELTCVTHMG